MPGNETAVRRAFRTLALLACSLGVAAAVLAAGLAWLGQARLGRPTTVFDYSRVMAKRLPEVAAARSRGETTVAMIGASALVSYPEGRRVPDRLQERLPFRVVSLGVPGSGPFDTWAFADEISETRPSLAVIAVNLDHFSDAWLGAYARPQLAGFVAPRRLPEALALPLDRVGLTADRLFAYVLTIRAGFYDAWYRLTIRQAQLGRARAQLEAWLQGGEYVARNDRGDDTPERLFRRAVSDRTLARVFSDTDLRHYREAALREHYAKPLAGLDAADPTVRVLAATLRRLRDGGIPTLLYLEPLETGPLARHGLLDREGLARTLQTLDETARANGAVFVDLHDALPPEAFRDAPGHLAFEGDVDGPDLLADALAPVVRRALEADGAR